MPPLSAHPCAICGLLTQDALCGNRLLLRVDADRLPTKDVPPILWRCRSHQCYQMRQARAVRVSEQGDLIYTLTCGHKVCWVCRGQTRGQRAYTLAKLAQALTTCQIRMDQPLRCYRCGDVPPESEANP